jgi:hypothetical protein
MFVETILIAMTLSQKLNSPIHYINTPNREIDRILENTREIEGDMYMMEK